MKNQLYDYCLTLFPSQEDMRPAMKQIALIGEEVYACSPYAMAIVNQKHCVKQYEKVKDYPAADKVFYDGHERNVYRININDLFTDLVNINLFFEQIYNECDECYGSGEVECHCCGQDTECSVCSGSGKVKTKIVKVKSKNKFKILEKYYDPDFFNKIALCAKILGEDNAVIKQREDGTGATIIEVGEMSFLIMEKQGDDF